MKSFDTESSGYQKTILSDLQAALTNFRDTVADNAGFEGWEKVLFHTDEAMSWETVRTLKLMPPLVLVVRTLCIQGDAPEEVMFWRNGILKKTLERLSD